MLAAVGAGAWELQGPLTDGLARHLNALLPPHLRGKVKAHLDAGGKVTLRMTFT